MPTEPLNLNTRYDGDTPVVDSGSVRSASLDALLRNLPALFQPDHLPEYCEALLHLHRPGRYRLIDDPVAFRRDYEARYVAEAQQDNFTDGILRLSDLGLFDTREIARPAADGERVVFYVEEVATGAPWRVVAASPPAAARGSTQIDLQPLPHVETEPLQLP